MQGDNVVRFLLTVIAAALVVLVIQGFDRSGGGEDEAGELSRGRYTLNMMRSRRGQMLLKLDSHTGRVWRTNPDGSDAWSEVGAGEPSSEPEAEAASPPAGGPGGAGPGAAGAPPPQ